jgi:hypothetical protein
VQVQIEPALEAIPAARQMFLAEAPRASEFPVQTVRVDGVQALPVFRLASVTPLTEPATHLPNSNLWFECGRARGSPG